MENNKHYICTGRCDGEAKIPDVCKSKTCPDRGKPFKECDCFDGQHAVIESEGDTEEKINQISTLDIGVLIWLLCYN